MPTWVIAVSWFSEGKGLFTGHRHSTTFSTTLFRWGIGFRRVSAGLRFSLVNLMWSRGILWLLVPMDCSIIFSALRSRRFFKNMEEDLVLRILPGPSQLLRPWIQPARIMTLPLQLLLSLKESSTFFLGWPGSTHLTHDPVTRPGRWPGRVLKLW